MKYEEKKADVTKMPKEYSIAHCISCDCAMGKGVVVPIKEKFKRVKAECINYANSCDPYKTAFRYSDENGVCYNMFTKQKVWHNSSRGMSYDEYIDNIKSTLNDVKVQMIAHNESKLAMPKIGCGLDRCNWDDVKNIIFSVFSNTDIEICICYI